MTIFNDNNYDHEHDQAHIIFTFNLNFIARITNGKFDLNGKTYQLALNNGKNALHGGLKGFDKRKWNIITETENSITLQLTAEDGEEGYPGKLRVEVTYSVSEVNELRLEYSAKLTENQSIDTIVNLTNHSYFNLNGCSTEQDLDVLNHTVQMKSDHYIEVNSDLQPTGKVLSVKTDSPLMDFNTKSHTIGERIAGVKPNGYDHCFVIENDEKKFKIEGNDSIRENVVVVVSPSSGIKLSFSTTEPGFQFYSGNFLTDEQKTKKSQSSKQMSLRKNCGFCLESSRFPNAINEEKWKKQVILDNKHVYKQTTSYKFSL